MGAIDRAVVAVIRASHIPVSLDELDVRAQSVVHFLRLVKPRQAFASLRHVVGHVEVQLAQIARASLVLCVRVCVCVLEV